MTDRELIAEALAKRCGFEVAEDDLLDADAVLAALAAAGRSPADLDRALDALASLASLAEEMWSHEYVFEPCDRRHIRAARALLAELRS